MQAEIPQYFNCLTVFDCLWKKNLPRQRGCNIILESCTKTGCKPYLSGCIEKRLTLSLSHPTKAVALFSIPDILPAVR